jgi:hypothetical protein
MSMRFYRGHPVGAKALVQSAGFVRGLKPPAPSGLSFPQHVKPVPFNPRHGAGGGSGLSENSPAGSPIVIKNLQKNPLMFNGEQISAANWRKVSALQFVSISQMCKGAPHE